MFAKVCFKEANVLKEVRIFDLGFNPTFTSLVKACEENFPISSKSYKILWKDPEGDEVTIVNGKDFDYVLLQPAGFKFTVKVENQCKEDGNEQTAAKHTTVTCDGCGTSAFSGFRYKCLECDDYDLCTCCENIGIHPDHWMIRIPKPVKLSRHFRHLCGFARQFANKSSYESDEKHKCPYRHGTHHAFNRKGSCRANKRSGGADTGATCTLQGFMQSLLTSLGVDADVNLFSDYEEAQHETEPNTNEPNGAFKKMDTQFSDDKSAEKKSEEKETTNTMDCDPLTKDSTPLPMQNNISMPMDSAEDWTLVEKSSSSSSSSASLSASVNTSAAVHPETQAQPTAPQMDPPNESTPEKGGIRHNNPKIEKALNMLLSMGFSLDVGMLTRLLEVNDGNIEKVLNIILS